LTCSEIKNSVNDYNSGQALSHDLALKAALAQVQTLSPCAPRFLAEICVVAPSQRRFDDARDLRAQHE
jgi:hypothetical protein